MPWIEFGQAFEWSPKPNVIIVYKAGHRYLVTQRCARDAIAKGKGQPCKRPERRDERGRAAAPDRV